MNRKTPFLTLSLLLALPALLLLPGRAEAWRTYSQGCNNCHGDRKHGVHRENVNNECNLCHQASTGDPVVLNNSVGGLPGPGPSDLGCLGCHGRDDGTGTIRGYGVRLHHTNSGINACIGCHPGDPMPVGEDVLPPYFVRTDVVPQDPCNEGGSEDYDGDGTGLDNDGDLLYDANDPDCQVTSCVATAAATPPTAALCEGSSVTLSDDGSSANCPAGGGLIFEWWEGPAGDPGSSLLTSGPAETSYDLPTTLTPGSYQYDLLVYCDNDDTCRDSLDTLIQVNVLNMPGVIDGLKAVKLGGTSDAEFGWTMNPDAGYYRLYSVTSTAAFPPRGENGSNLVCETDVSTFTCTHTGALSDPEPKLFYQVVGDCDDDATTEGPN